MSIIVLAGGGTGGHVYPALAIGDVLKERGHTVLYYGDPDRLEGRVAPERGYDFRPVHAMQYPRGGLMGKVRFALGLLRSTLASRGQLKADKVDAVLGVGGYISAPPVLAAASLGLGRAIHEANVVPGMANKLCARVAQQILLTWEATRHRLPGSAPRHLVGVPVNPAVLQGTKEDALAHYGLQAGRPVVVFVGGSLGAARLNELAVSTAKAVGRTFQVVHITGPKYEAQVLEAHGGQAPEGVTVRGYEDKMAMAYAVADLVVCRAGSSTLAELTAVGRASLLIPSPNVTENHQEGNARSLEAVGAAEVLVEQGWELDGAVSRVLALAADLEHLREMGQAALGEARLDAARAAADVVESLLR
ncbi:MAG: UDP-N-acetylglucosamine--N-acetylmuramyl-(pentapeptide) pyrophosphoryl-undecaprenol N-acetylglucosamine transferase [Deltaproteobacteria bacterium]|nr:UDP-N-acetylglucosamine--N-acetylmuramyl-(pentapeptide) pyrophosphoryl-undecaprenol N-acetylglucosamine transferase [Deltaproteobacteria bacterium]